MSMRKIERKEFKNKIFSMERDLYGIENAVLTDCRFEGELTEESAIKEAKNVKINNCFFDLRYPFWHNKNLNIIHSTFTENCRAPLWYSKGITIFNSTIHAPKSLRECKNIEIDNCDIKSDEILWKCRDIHVLETRISGEYSFLECKNIKIKELHLKGKYSFQYVNNLEIDSSYLNTKDAFWHAKNVIVTNSIINGEYLGWYSENITFINCKISGTQPLCYCKHIKLINCEFIDCDLAFENSVVNGNIIGDILSIKNLKGGVIKVDKVNKIIHEEGKFKLSGKIVQK